MKYLAGPVSRLPSRKGPHSLKGRPLSQVCLLSAWLIPPSTFKFGLMSIEKKEKKKKQDWMFDGFD